MSILGKRVRDTATGIEGVVVQRNEHLGGYVAVCLAVPDGAKPAEYWIAEARVEEVDGDQQIGFRASNPTG